MNILRDYQREMLDRLNEAWKTWPSVMVQMPTGTGKTYLMAEVIRENMDKGVLIVAHRVELIAQISNMLDIFGVTHGIIDRWTADTDIKHVVVASIQTLSRRKELLDEAGHVGLIIIDEAHHAVAKTYRWLWDNWPEAKFLGLTATPCRLNGTGFTDLFDTMLQSWSIQEFIDKGWLTDFDYVSVTPDNWMVERQHGLTKRGVDGDYQAKEMATVMDTPESVRHLYQSYKQYVEGKKGIVYAINREHARHIAEYYSKQGVRCCWVEAMTPADERQKLVEDYREGRLDIIVNVDIFSEGFDCPEVEFIQLARPTLSLSKYLQQVGRGMRYVPQKDYVVILDQVGMYQTFGLPTEERYWNLMFEGKMTGRGQQGSERGYVIRDEGSDLKLVNLEMVRIKRHGEKSTGVEVFIKDGRYGILKDGKVSCPAVFEHVRRAKAPYFALATYPAEVYRNRTTVIGEDGEDQNLKLYGKVEQQDDYIVYLDEGGKQMWWDGKGGRNYTHRPGIEQMGGFDVVKEGGQYMLRKNAPKLDFWFYRSDVLLGPRFSIFKNMLVFNDFEKVLRVVGYLKDCILVDSGNYTRGLMAVKADGTIQEARIGADWDSYQWPPAMKQLGLRRINK